MALVGALVTMRENYRDQEQWVGREILLMRYLWYDIDVNQNVMMNEKEFIRVCERINLFVPSAAKRFREFLSENNIRGKDITYGECTKLLDILKGKQVIDDIWRRLFGSQVSVNPKKLHERFLKMCQGEKKTTLQNAKDLIVSLNTVELGEGSEPRHMLRLEKDRFEEYLRSEWNDAFDPQKQVLPKKGLTKPLSAYWISCSHNTYLTGDQFKSMSSVGAYTRALLRGCKCLEIDVWDGPKSRKGDLVPMVYHGQSFTSKIEFDSILAVVNNFLAKHPESYPIILSLENHCSIPYQEVMAKRIKRIFGVRLFKPSSSQRKVQMPSPEELKGMVIIMGKRPPEPDDKDEDAKPKSTDTFMDELFDTMDSPPEQFRPATSTDDVAYSKEMLEITYFHGITFKYFEDSIEMVPSHTHSINEARIERLVTQYDNNPDLWRQYNKDHITRIYPAGARIDSSNYNPVLAWAMGCQMVSLNFQTPGSCMILNDGRFRQNGNCGYVAKPPPTMISNKRPVKKKIKLRILSGSCLPKPAGNRVGEHVDPLVRIEVHDVRVTKWGKEQFYIEKHSTKRVENNGFAPIFDDKGFGFTVHNPGVAMIMFRLFDTDATSSEHIASAAIPISCLRKGFRSIQLYNSDNTRTGPFQYATLLAHIIF